MRKLNITDYNAKVLTQKGPQEITVNVRQELAALVFHEGLGLNAVQALFADDLARRILDEKPDDILLEETEYEHIKKAVDVHRGFQRSAVPLIKRINDCESVDVSGLKAVEK